MSEGPTGSDPGQRGPDLSELRSRLAALQGSVERLGRDDDRVPPAAPAPGPYAYPDPAEAPASPYQGSTPPSEGAAAPYPQAPATEWGYDPYAEPAQPQPPADPYGQPTAPADTDPYQPAPAATNGQGEHEAGATAIAANVAILDIGPFADLIELRHFEEAVAGLEAVLDVRVRRFGHRRAMVELGLAGPYAIGRELFRLGRPLQVEPGPEGEIVVDFTDVPAEPRAEPAEPQSAPGEGPEDGGAPAEGESTEGESTEAGSAAGGEGEET